MRSKKYKTEIRTAPNLAHAKRQIRGRLEAGLISLGVSRALYALASKRFARKAKEESLTQHKETRKGGLGSNPFTHEVMKDVRKLMEGG